MSDWQWLAVGALAGLLVGWAAADWWLGRRYAARLARERAAWLLGEAEIYDLLTGIATPAYTPEEYRAHVAELGAYSEDGGHTGRLGALVAWEDEQT